MPEALNAFTSAFLPLFIAIDAVGVVPLFMSLTDDCTPPQRRRLASQAVVTALVVSLIIVLAGDALFGVLGITLNDLRVGGGIVLLVLAITELFFGEKRQRAPQSDDDEDDATSDRGIVPLGIPLVCGPAAITTLIVSQQAHGVWITVLSLAANLVIVLVVFWGGPWLLSRLGTGTSKAIAKVANLFLAAIAVALIRAGIFGMIEAA
ncbi:MAG TPA: MarC family protein [Rhodothermales bacterium]|nr:MarC family protein [Rhodothermales bacterium]